MEASSGLTSFLRNRKISSGSSKFHRPPSNSTDEPHLMEPLLGVNNKHQNNEVYDDDDDDDDGWLSMMISCIRILACFVSLIITTFIWILIMIVLLPWPYQRIKQSNIYGQVTGRIVMWILGNPIKIEGVEYSDEKAIYIVYYPLVGQIYVLANHLRIDRSNPASAIESMNKAADELVKHNLSLIIFPEGTRSKNGRLLPFKKGFVHMAVQTRLPIVPIVLTGTHRAWRKDSLHLRPAPLAVKYLPPVKTDHWTEDKIDDYANFIHDIYINNLPESQKPLML